MEFWLYCVHFSKEDYINKGTWTANNTNNCSDPKILNERILYKAKQLVKFFRYKTQNPSKKYVYVNLDKTAEKSGKFF